MAVTSSVGAFSGIDREAIISQLLQIDAAPRTTAQNRIRALQGTQAAYLDLNTRVAALRSAGRAFSTNNTFNAAAASSSNADALTASVTSGAALGTYSFLVDRLTSSQQQISRGFADRDTTGIGPATFTIESAQGRVDRDTPLSQLNGGLGVARGRIVVTDGTGASSTVDLTRVETVNEVLSAINSATGVRVRAQVQGDRLVIRDTSGGAGSLTIANATGFTTATSLGIAGTTTAGTPLSGNQIARVGNATSLASLNDGLGVSVSQTSSNDPTPDFTITSRDGTAFNVDIGDIWGWDDPNSATRKLVVKQPAVKDIAGVLARINSATGGKVVASINPDGSGLTLTDTTAGSGSLSVSEYAGGGTPGRTAAELGILGTATGNTITGSRILAGINSTLTSNLNGGRGLSDGTFTVKARDGSNIFVDVNLALATSVSDIIDQFNTQTSGKVTLELDANGTGFIARDTTGGGSSLTISGGGATSLGIATSGNTTGVVQGSRLQHKWVNESTKLSSLNGGKGVGTGQFEITDSGNRRILVNIRPGDDTLGKVIKQINDASSANGNRVKARINDNGDGIVLEENIPSGQSAGGTKITLRDLSGAVAKGLNLVGTASGTGAANKIDGSFERTITVAAGDTLNQVVEKINNANTGVTASVISDGTSGNPFRLQISARQSGRDGAFTFDDNGFGLGFTQISSAQNARVFVGSGEPASSLLFSSSSNTVTGVAGNLTLNLKQAKPDPITVSVTRDTETIEKAVDDFVKAFNDLTNRIDTQSKYDADTQKRGALLGDSNAQSLRASLYSAIVAGPKNVSGRYQNLAQVGISINRDGNLDVNKDKLRDALATDPQAVADLLSAKTATPAGPQQVRDAQGNAITGAFVNSAGSSTFTSLGIGEIIGNIADSYIRAVDGVLTRANKTLDDQIKQQNDRITSINNRLTQRRDFYTRQFIAMETAIGKLQGQSGALNSIQSLSTSR